MNEQIALALAANAMLTAAKLAAPIVTIAVFTASITSVLTIKHLQGTVHGVSDLAIVRVGAIAGTSTEDTFNRLRINYRKFTTLQDGLDALRAAGSAMTFSSGCGGACRAARSAASRSAIRRSVLLAARPRFQASSVARQKPKNCSAAVRIPLPHLLLSRA